MNRFSKRAFGMFAPRTHVNDLPDDILVIIFGILISERLQYRKFLLLTNKRWHSVAKNYAPLWTSIAWAWHGDGHSNRILCSNLRILSKVIGMAGQAPLDLYFCVKRSNHYTDDSIAEFTASVPVDWASFCHSLHLSNSAPGKGTSGIGKFAKLFGPASFTRLENLELEEPRNEDGPSLMRHILESIQGTSLGLRRLRTNHAAAIFGYPPILRRLTELHIADPVVQTIPWQYLANLEKLAFSWPRNPNEEALSNLTRLNLLELKMGSEGFTLTSPRFLNLLGAQLTHLTLTNLYISFSDTIQLPNLLYLSIFCCGSIRYDTIAAPKVSELVFWYPYNESGENHLSVATFSPKQVVVNLNKSSIRVFNNFFEAMNLWTQVEELHLRMDYSDRAHACLEAIIDNLKDQNGALHHLKLDVLSILYDGSKETNGQMHLRGQDDTPELLLCCAAPALSRIERLMVGAYSQAPHRSWRSQWIQESMDSCEAAWMECKEVVKEPRNRWNIAAWTGWNTKKQHNHQRTMSAWGLTPGLDQFYETAGSEEDAELDKEWA